MVKRLRHPYARSRPMTSIVVHEPALQWVTNIAGSGEHITRDMSMIPPRPKRGCLGLPMQQRSLRVIRPLTSSQGAACDNGPSFALSTHLGMTARKDVCDELGSDRRELETVQRSR